MGFSSAFKENIMTNIGSKLEVCFLLNDASSVSLDDTVYDKISNGATDLPGVELEWSWDSGTSSLVTKNYLFDIGSTYDANPILFKIPIGQKPDKLMINSGGGGAALALHDTGKSTYTEQDIIYIRKITLTINEV